MRLFKSRLVLLILLLTLAIGCRSDGTQQPDAAATTRISVAGSPNFQAAYEHIFSQFQEDHPLIQVQFISLSQQQASFSLREQAALADVLLLEGQPPTTAAAFLDLTPLMAADPTFDADDFWPGIMDACRAAGVQVGLPFRANASLVFFDKAAFDAAGLTHPEPGWNWEDFRQAAQALALSDGEQTTRYGFADSGNPLGLLAPLVDNIIAQSGDSLDGQRIAAELEWYVILAGENVIFSESGTPVNNLFSQRQVGMWVSSQFGLATAQGALGDDLGVISFPAAAGLSQSNPVSAGCALISAGTNHSQAAWTFVHYLSQQALFATSVYPVAPARPSITQSNAYWERMGVETAVALRAALENGWYRRAEMPELTTVGNALSQALAGETTLAESLPGTVEIQPTPLPPMPDSDPVVVATPRATPTPGSDVIVIEYSLRGHGDWEAIIALAEAFNESQERIRVNATTRLALPQGGTLVQFADEFDCFMEGIRPDIAFDQLGTPFLEAYYSLSPLFQAEDAAFQSDFALMSEHLERNSVDGELYALPVAIYPTVLHYNADLLVERDIDPPAPDWTIEDFWALAQAAGSGSAYGLVTGDGILPDELLSFVPGAAYYFDLDTRPLQPRFTDPAVIGALEFLGRMAEEGILYPHTEWASRRTVMEDLDVRGQSLGVISASRAAITGHQVGSGAGSGSFGVVPFPQRTLPNLGGNEGGGRPTMLYISRRSPDPTACWEWFKFLTAQPGAFQGIPVRQSVRESQAWRDVVGEETAVAYEIMYSRPQDWEPDIGWETLFYRTWWADALHSVYRGEDPGLMLALAQQRAEAFYDCYAPLAIEVLPDFPTYNQARQCAQQADPDYRR
jgi:ABC-type glycerol-3-phosphate transport system substrate-binding protein